jgi:hypothetical protein
VSGRLKLRRATVVSQDPLTVELDGKCRPAWADTGLLGEMLEGDSVIVNVAALDLDLGSGGFDLIHANLTRGLGGATAAGEHVMKLNYTSLQHPVDPVDRPLRIEADGRSVPVLVLPLHGHLAPAAWAAHQQAPALRLGYVQTAGGALPGALSRDVAMLRGQGLLSGHVTAAPAYGGEQEAISVVGALDAAAQRLGWDAVLAGPGPGIIGSETHFGHGGLIALDSAHAALSLGMPTLLSPRLSAADPRPRHRGVSHHTLAVLELLLAPVRVAAPQGEEEILASLSLACAGRHRIEICTADLNGYAATGLPSKTMGRGLDQDPAFFAAPLAAGRLLVG